MGQCNSLNHNNKSKQTNQTSVNDDNISSYSTSTTSSNHPNNIYSSPIKRSRTTKPSKYKGGSYCQDIREVYKFKELLASGKFGSVHLAFKRNEPDHDYAIKSIPKKTLSPKVLTDILNEVEITSQLKHPNIVKVYETYYDEKYYHIVMELCKGKEIIDWVSHGEVIKEDTVVRVILKVLEAVSYCHSKGIVHRDLKPENIIFDDSSDEGEVKLIDFGFAKKYDYETDDLMSSILGSPYYIAPEVLKGEYDQKCDVWSIGIIAYLMLCGELPFHAKSTTELYNKILTDDFEFLPIEKWSHISSQAKQFIQLCLVKSIDNRWNSSEAIEHDWFKTVFMNKEPISTLNECIMMTEL